MSDITAEPLSNRPRNEKCLRILHAIDRRLGELSVQDICDKVGISHQTFYSYFDSKYDIPAWLLSACYGRSIHCIGSLFTYLALRIMTAALFLAACSPSTAPSDDSGSSSECAWAAGNYTVDENGTVQTADGTAQSVNDFCLSCHQDGHNLQLVCSNCHFM